VPASLVMQLAKRMRPVMSSFVTCTALPHFTILSHTARIFRGGGRRLSINEYFDLFYTTVQLIEMLSQMYVGFHV